MMSNAKDYSLIRNPYDFANPVSNENLFAGRADEIQDIRYYLDQAKTSQHCINLALLGPRASGKTSLLNITAIEARARNLCTVRIDLDEGDITSEMGFFFKIFDHLVTEAFGLGLYGGLTDKTYSVYVDMVYAFDVPEDRAFTPFLFPLQYAKAMAKGNEKAQVSNNAFVRDLQLISRELQRPVVLLFDEGNVLVNSRILLEKLRNIFQNVPGYMLVLAGTLDLFPTIDHVFSPISRGFKKIAIGSFKKTEETKDLIRKPLQNEGIDPREIFDFQTYADVEELHKITSGKPYEIQLLCHVLFRRVQEKRATKMQLNVSALEEVVRELESTQDVSTRPLLTMIRNLKRSHIVALGAICCADQPLTYDQAWAAHYLLLGDSLLSRSEFEEALQYFLSNEIIRRRGEVIDFIGDDFDKLYFKYFCLEQELPMNFGIPVELLWRLTLDALLASEQHTLGFWTPVYGTKSDIQRAISVLADVSTEDDIFAEESSVAWHLYKLMIDHRDIDEITLIFASLVFPWVTVHSFVVEGEEEDETFESYVIETQKGVERAQEVGGSLNLTRQVLRIIPLKSLIAKVLSTENTGLRSSLANWHLQEMVDSYVDSHDTEDALFHANIALEYDPSSSEGWANAGYLFMSVEDNERALKLLTKAASSEQDSFSHALALYNLAILQSKLGRHSEALELITSCLNAMDTIKNYNCSCLFQPILVAEELKYDEVWNVSLRDIAITTKATLEEYCMRQIG